MTKPLYTPESEADTQLDHLGYNASVHDLLVQAAHKELNRFLENEGEAVQMWGWNSRSLHATDRYRIAQLLRSFIYQEQRIVAALHWLDEQYRAYADSSPQARANAKAFIDSLNQGAARRAIDHVVGGLPEAAAAELTDDKRDRAAKDVVAKWQQEAPKADAHVSSADTNPLEAFRPSRRVAPGQSVLEQSTMLVGGVLVDHLGPALAQTVGAFLGSVLGDSRFRVVRESPFTDKYLPPPFRRLHAVRSVVDFHDPEISHDLGPRGFAYASAPTDAEGNKRPKDTSFQASGFDMELWRLKDHGYPRTRIPDGLLYDLVDSVLAVQAEYQLQCVFVDRELANIIDSRGKEEQWLYQKTAEWAVERARAEMEAKEKSSAFWGYVGDILGLVSAAAGVLALIPIFTPLMAPVAIVTAVASMGAHAAAVSIAGNWDDPAAIAGLAADTLAAIPAVGAVAKGARAAWAAARMNKVANVIVNQGGRAFAGAIAGKGASDASHIFDYIGQKGAQVVKGTVSQGQIAGKVLQGSVSLATQVPLVIELSTKTAVDQQAKDAATGTALTANIGNTVGGWDVVGALAKKPNISLERFSRFFSHR